VKVDAADPGGDAVLAEQAVQGQEGDPPAEGFGQLAERGVVEAHVDHLPLLVDGQMQPRGTGVESVASDLEGGDQRLGCGGPRRVVFPGPVGGRAGAQPPLSDGP